MNIYEIFLMFILYSTLGWIIEVITVFVSEKKIVNRGFLIGPCCPIYGWGGVLITLFLTKYSDSPITLFVMAVFICAILEYATSYLMEKLFNARWWDYTDKKFNINGRICLETLSGFGLLGCILIYVTNPVMYKIFEILTPKYLNIISIILFIIFAIDSLVSLEIISKFKITTTQFRNKDNTEEITKKVREILSMKSPFTKRLIDAFPNVKTVIISFKNELRKTKDELKCVKKNLKKTEKKLKKAEKKIKKKSKIIN